MKVIKLILINFALFFVFFVLFCLVPGFLRLPFLFLVSYAFYRINTCLISGKSKENKEDD